ncbi:MAG: HD domain-containing protein [Lachnospiraceae bacterium]|nr:HD domain-containing protein [Lachnospiraceae bacterium]
MRDFSTGLFDAGLLYRKTEAFAGKHELEDTLSALPFAKKAHQGQLRDCAQTVPYIVHPLQMALHAIHMGIGEDEILATALLHDVCEDCNISKEELPVSESVREAVMLLTKDWGSGEKTKEKEDLYYKKISENKTATIVKLLDRCNNVSSMASGFTQKRIAGYLQETEEYYMPLMETALERYPEFREQIFLIYYQMHSVMEALERMLRESRQ